MVVQGGVGGAGGEEGARNTTMKTANKEDDLFQLTQLLDSTRLLLQGITNLSSPGQSKGRSSLVPLSASAHDPRSHPWGVGSFRKYTEAQGGVHQLTGDGASCASEGPLTSAQHSNAAQEPGSRLFRSWEQAAGPLLGGGGTG